MTERNEVSRNWAADLVICEAATAGLWYIPKLKYEEDYQIYTNVNGVKIAAGIPTDKHDDARFIAEARTGWPAALTEIERLTSVLARFDDRTNPMLPRSEMARIAKEELDETVGYAVDDAEIRRLRVENRRYRQALESIAEYAGLLTGEDAREMRDIAEGVLAYDEVAT